MFHINRTLLENGGGLWLKGKNPVVKKKLRPLNHNILERIHPYRVFLITTEQNQGKGKTLTSFKVEVIQGKKVFQKRIWGNSKNVFEKGENYCSWLFSRIH